MSEKRRDPCLRRLPWGGVAVAVGMLSMPLAGLAQTTVTGIQQPAPVSGVVAFSASATIEVTRDVLAVVFTASKEGADAQSVQVALKQALDAALAEARKIARPGQVDVETGNFALYPRYTSKGAINGWQGSTQLTVQGKDASAIAALTARIATMVVARVGYELSREARDKVEADVTAQAIGRFRAKATELSKQFGFGNYVIRDVNVSTNEPGSGAPMMRARVSEAATQYDPLPTEAGKASVTATVGGSVQMTR